MATTLGSTTYDLLINGHSVKAASGQTFAAINPATNEKIADVASAGIHDADAAVDAARKALDGKWSTMAPARARVLFKIAELIGDRIDDLAHMEVLNSGKTIAGAKAEIGQVMRISSSMAAQSPS